MHPPNEVRMLVHSHQKNMIFMILLSFHRMRQVCEPHRSRLVYYNMMWFLRYRILRCGTSNPIAPRWDSFRNHNCRIDVFLLDRMRHRSS